MRDFGKYFLAKDTELSTTRAVKRERDGFGRRTVMWQSTFSARENAFPITIWIIDGLCGMVTKNPSMTAVAYTTSQGKM